MKNKKRHVIWSNIHLNLDDWREDIIEDYPEYKDSEERLTELMYERNAEYLDDVRMNLDHIFSKPIIIVADLGLWYGRRSGYKILKSGNLSDCLYAECDMAEWYVDELGDLRADVIHHDGENHYLYRAFKEDISEDRMETLKSKIYNGVQTRRDITNCTRRLGDIIAGVYGFKI